VHPSFGASAKSTWNNLCIILGGDRSAFQLVITVIIIQWRRGLQFQSFDWANSAVDTILAARATLIGPPSTTSLPGILGWMGLPKVSDGNIVFIEQEGGIIGASFLRATSGHTSDWSRSDPLSNPKLLEICFAMCLGKESMSLGCWLCRLTKDEVESAY
jgi:hypothetical protein